MHGNKNCIIRFHQKIIFFSDTGLRYFTSITNPAIEQILPFLRRVPLQTLPIGVPRSMKLEKISHSTPNFRVRNSDPVKHFSVSRSISVNDDIPQGRQPNPIKSPYSVSVPVLHGSHIGVGIQAIHGVHGIYGIHGGINLAYGNAVNNNVN